MYVHGQIETENIIALVDTGASGLAFVSRTLCGRFRQNPLPLLSPIALVGFEGTKSSNITHTISLRLALGNHVEIITAYVIEKCKYDLILGLPWLERHAPYVDWNEHSLTFGEPCLRKNCCQFETTIPYTNSPTMSAAPS